MSINAKRLVGPLVLLVLLALGAVGLAGAARWIGQPFAGFLLLENRVVASAGLARWPAIESGAIYQHEVVAVGGAPLTGPAQLHSLVASVPPGTPLVYRLRADQREIERVIATRRFEMADFALLFGVYAATSLAFGLGGLALLRSRMRDAALHNGVPALFITSFWVLSAMDLYGPYRLFRLHALCEALLWPAVLQMALCFPRPPGWLAQRPQLAWLPYAVALPAALAYQWALPEPAAYVTAHLAATSAFGAALPALLASQLLRWLARLGSDARAVAVAIAAALTLIPAVLLTLGEFANGGRLSQNALCYTAFAFPLALGWWVARTNALGRSR